LSRLKITIKGKINPIYIPHVDSQSKVNIYYGGAGAGKSVFKAQDLVMNMMKGGRNYLVVMAAYNTLADATYNEILKAIDSFGFTEYFTYKASPLKITCYNGYQILFKGLDKSEKLKGVTPRKGVLTDIWVEEADNVCKKDFLTLNTRLRGQSGGKVKRMHLTFNPTLATHWIRKTFFKNVDETFHKTDELLILKATHLDNKFLEPEDHERYEAYKETDNYFYQVYTLGNWGVLSGLIFNQKNWVQADLSDIRDNFAVCYYGMDFGYEHPKAFLQVAVAGKTIYVLREVGGSHITNMEFVPKILPIIGGQRLSCDSAGANDVAEFKQLGVKGARGVKKPPGSVRYGIQWLKNYKIVIDKTCLGLIANMKAYSWLLDKTGGSTGEPKKVDDDYIDALRYALYNFMKANSGAIQGVNLKLY